MRRFAVAAACAVVCALGLAEPRPAAADILVNVSKASQRMTVMVDGSARYNWRVSTGSGKNVTPSGSYQPQWMARKWRSRQYHNAPMPHSIFFHKGYAVHGTSEVAQLGRAASHGCVRLHPENAAKLYQLVEKQLGETRIVVSNDVIEAPGAPQPAPKKPNRYVAEAEIEPAAAAARATQAEILTSDKQVAVEDLAVAAKSESTRRPVQAQRAAPPAREAKAGRAPVIRTAERFETYRGFRW